MTARTLSAFGSSSRVCSTVPIASLVHPFGAASVERPLSRDLFTLGFCLALQVPCDLLC